MKSLKATLLGLVCAIGVTAPAHAATLSFTDSVDEEASVTFDLNPNSGTRTTNSFERNKQFSGDAFTLNQFDASLGTLTGVELVFSTPDPIRTGWSLSIFCSDNGRFNPSCTRQRVTADDLKMETGVRVFSRDVLLARTTPFGTLGHDSNAGSAFGGQDMTPAFPSGTRTLTYTSDLDAFIGMSTLSFSLFNSYAADMAVNCDASIGTSVNLCQSDLSLSVRNRGNAQITYTYDTPVSVVPLPAAAWLLLTALGGLVALRKRKALS